MSVVDNLFNNNVPITITGGVELSANLVASPWNRTTVADGYWLQTKTVDPFSARDIYLANCIDDALNRISDVETAILDGTSNNIGSMNNVIYSANNYWEGLPATITPSNTSQVAPSNTLTYMTLGEDSDVATDDISLKNDRTCLIQGNLTENSFNQILLTDSGMFYRSVSGDETAAVTDGDKIDSYDVLETSKEFSQILDDSTIDSAGYWFLHKESSGRPVWTNINALGDYIDNRVNPDQIYVGWDDGDPDAEYPERKLILFPPIEGLNTTSSVDPTSEMYMNDAYVWTESGWAGLPSLMSREEITETIDEGLPLKDFLQDFVAYGAYKFNVNTGCFIASEKNTSGTSYFKYSGTNFFTNDSRGYPREVVGYNSAESYTARGGYVTAYTAADTPAIQIPKINKACFEDGGTIGDYHTLDPVDNSAVNITKPIFIRLTPFKFADDAGIISIPREWNLHFMIKGSATFCRNEFTGTHQPYGDKDPLRAPATINVSIICSTANDPSTDAGYINRYSKQYYISDGEFIRNRMYELDDGYKSSTANPPGSAAFIQKEINFHQQFESYMCPNSSFVPWLRVCIKGLSGVDNLGICIDDFANVNNSNVTLFPFDTSTQGAFIEEIKDDRLMSAAYRYVTG